MSATIEYRWALGASGITHAVPSGEEAALCGRRPMRGWGSPIAGLTAPTCDRCRRKLGMGLLQPPRAEGGAE